jgi:hypothetical protein
VIRKVQFVFTYQKLSQFFSQEEAHAKSQATTGNISSVTDRVSERICLLWLVSSLLCGPAGAGVGPQSEALQIIESIKATVSVLQLVAHDPSLKESQSKKQSSKQGASVGGGEKGSGVG